MSTAEQIAELLLTVKAVKLSTNPPFTWTSGLKAPIYCDNRLLISYPQERQVIVNAWKELIAEHRLAFDVVGGTATAAIPWAAFLAYDLHKPMIYIRPEPKGHGAGKQVEGFMEKNARVLIVEDLISTGGSSIRSAEACKKEYGAAIAGVIAIFTYEMHKAAAAFREADIPCYTLTTFSTLIDVATKTASLRPEEKTSVLAWSQSPEAWGVS